MPLLGKAAVAMWWTIPPERRAEFGDWHSHEHFPERMSIPGFRRGSRWTSTLAADDFFVLYELEQYDTLISKGYLDRLNAPTPWSTKMMPHHLGMIRSQCRVAASFGGGIATALATIRFSAAAGRDAELKSDTIGLLSDVATKAGLTGAHLLLTDTPVMSSPTTEQRIRGSDGAADWIVVVAGYEAAVVRDCATSHLLPALRDAGALPDPVVGQYQLGYALSALDLADAR